MVGSLRAWLAGGPLLMADPQQLALSDKARLLVAFLAVLGLSLLLVVIVWLAARVTRRYLNSLGPSDSTTLPQDEWHVKPLGQSEQPGDET